MIAPAVKERILDAAKESARAAHAAFGTDFINFGVNAKADIRIAIDHNSFIRAMTLPEEDALRIEWSAVFWETALKLTRGEKA